MKTFKKKWLELFPIKLEQNIVFCLIIFITINLSGQIHNYSSLTSEEKDKLLELLNEELLNKGPDLHFSISQNDAKRCFEDIQNEKKYDIAELNKRLDTLKNNKLDSRALYLVADYYDNVNNQVLAKSYYKQSYDKLNKKFFEDDSAAYYSFRAILKNKLKVPNAFKDFERSIAINPNDSSLMNIYPLILISGKKFEKARELVINALEAKPKDPAYLYMTLFSIELFEKVAPIMFKVNSNRIYSEEIRDKNYDEMIDFTHFDTYANKYKNNLEIANIRMMIDIVLLFNKIMLFEPTEHGKPSYNYNAYELKKMEDLKKKLANIANQKTMNEFSVNRCLGILYFMLEEWDKSIEHFNKAIKVAPLEKNGIASISNACYEAIMCIYKQTSDTLNYRKTIKRKIDKESLFENSVDELVLLAYGYYNSGNQKEAEEYCNQIVFKGINNFHALRLKAHINFLKGAYFQSQFYMKMAAKNFTNSTEEYQWAIQMAIYQIHSGNMEKAKTMLEIVKQNKGEISYPLCNKLIEEYCNAKTQ